MGCAPFPELSSTVCRRVATARPRCRSRSRDGMLAMWPLHLRPGEYSCPTVTSTRALLPGCWVTNEMAWCAPAALRTPPRRRSNGSSKASGVWCKTPVVCRVVEPAASLRDCRHRARKEALVFQHAAGIVEVLSRRTRECEKPQDQHPECHGCELVSRQRVHSSARVYWR